MITEKDIERWFESSHYRKKSDWICIDQPKVIEEWQKKNMVGQVIHASTIEKPSWAASIPSLSVSLSWLINLTGKPSHQGLMIIIEHPNYRMAGLVTTKRMLILDGIQDPGNMGTIIRSMVAFNCKALGLTNNCVDPFHPKSVNASTGAIANISIYYENHWKNWLKETKIPIYALDPLGSHSIWGIKNTGDFVLVCGSEGRGIQSKLIQSVTVHPLAIPITDEVESLNAGISVSIALNYLAQAPK